VFGIKIRKKTWMGGSYFVRMEDKGIKKSFPMGNFIIQDQWENQEKDGRASSGGTYHSF